MKIIVTVAAVLLLGVGTIAAQSGKKIRPSSTYRKTLFTAVSPSQKSWTLSRSEKQRIVFERRNNDELSRVSVEIVPTSPLDAGTKGLAELESRKNDELKAFKQDHLHFNYLKFDGSLCVKYDATFPLDPEQPPKFARYNLRGYLCPSPNDTGSFIQMEFANYSNTRGFPDELSDMVEKFFSKVDMRRYIAKK